MLYVTPRATCRYRSKTLKRPAVGVWAQGLVVLDAGTRARIIDSGFTKRQVRILDGPYRGRALWIVQEVTLIKEK